MLDFMLGIAFWYVGEWGLGVIYILMLTGGLVEPSNKAYAIIFIWLLVMIKKIAGIEKV